jgi:hypothetical protein
MRNLAALCLGIFLLSPNSIWAAAAAAATEVKKFKPAVPAGAMVSGSCWTESIAVQRTGAWRCMVGDEIYDPCFSAGQPNKVICDADPVEQKKGFVLQLTKPLPPRTFNVIVTDSAWLLQLDDGSVCRPYTGTMSAINGSVVRYYCSDSGTCKFGANCQHMTGLLDFPRAGKIWTVQKVTYSVLPTGEIKLEQNRQVTIKTVWR